MNVMVLLRVGNFIFLKKRWKAQKKKKKEVLSYLLNMSGDICFFLRTKRQTENPKLNQRPE
jgi:hypothetical protein